MRYGSLKVPFRRAEHIYDTFANISVSRTTGCIYLNAFRSVNGTILPVNYGVPNTTLVIGDTLPWFIAYGVSFF